MSCLIPSAWSGSSGTRDLRFFYWEAPYSFDFGEQSEVVCYGLADDFSYNGEPLFGFRFPE